MADLLQNALRAQQYAEALQRPDLTEQQRQALTFEINRLSGGAPLPLPPPAPTPVAVTDPLQAALTIREAAEQELEEELQQRTGTPGFDAAAYRQRRLPELEAARRRARDVAIYPGGAAPVPGATDRPELDVFRPTRLRQVQAPPAGADLLARSLQRMELQAELDAPDTPLDRRADLLAELAELEPAERTMMLTPEGELEEPSALRELFEATKAQQLMTEGEARQLAGRGEAPLGILAAQEEGVGIVETPLAQTLRVVLGSAEGLVGEAYIRGLGFEVDEEGNPKDPQDFAYRLRQAIQERGLEGLIPAELSLAELGLAPLMAPVTMAGTLVTGEDPLAEQRQALRSNWYGLGVIPGVFAPSESTTRKSTALDPDGRMVVSDIEVPSFFEDPAGFAEAETRRLARNLATGRGLLDEVRDSPASQSWAEQTFEDEDFAYLPGVPLMFLTPATPVGLAKSAVTGARAASNVGMLATKAPAGAARMLAPSATQTAASWARATRPGQAWNRAHQAAERATLGNLYNYAVSAAGDAYKAAADAGRAAADKALFSATLAAPGTTRSALRAYDSAVLATAKAMDALGAPAGAAWRYTSALPTAALGAGGRVNRHMTEAVLRRAGVGDELVKQLIRDIPFDELITRVSKTMRQSDEAWFKISRALEASGRLTSDELTQVERLLKLNLPEDYVMVTDSFAAPRGIADELRNSALQWQRAGASADAADAGRAVEQLVAEQIAAGATTPDRAAGLLRVAQQLVDAGQRASLTGGTALAREVVSPRTLSSALRGAGLEGGGRQAEGLLSASGDVLRRRLGLELVSPQNGKLDILDVDAAGRVLPFSEQSDQAAILDRLVARGLERDAGNAARRARDVGHMQMYLATRQQTLQTMAAALWRTPTGRKFFALASKNPTISDLTQFSVQLRDQLRRSGRLAGVRAARAVGERARTLMLDAIRRETGKTPRNALELNRLLSQSAYRRLADGERYVNQALDEMLGRGLAEFGVQPEQAWSQVFSLIYGEQVNPDDLVELLRSRRAADAGLIDAEGRLLLETQYPTIKSMQAVDAVLSRAAVENMAGPSRFNTPDFQGIAMGLYMDQVLRMELAGEAVLGALTSSGLNVSLWQAVSDGVSLRSAILDPGVQQLVRRLADEAPAHVPGPYGMNTPTYGTNKAIELELATAPQNFVEFLGELDPRGRRAVGQLIKDGIEYAAGNARLNLLQAVKYGYVLPNLRTGVGKAISGAFIAAAQIGVQNAVRGAVQAVRSRTLQALTQRHGGIRPGLSTPTGYYTGETLTRLAELNGVGYTGVQVERVYSLTADIFADAYARLPLASRPRWDAVSPLQKTYWIRTAEALDRSFRQGVFEARLMQGDSVQQAAKYARDALLDYDEVPNLVREKLGALFQGGATTYKLTTALAMKALENPRLVSGYLKGLQELQRQQDPYGIGGDTTLLNATFQYNGQNYLLGVPGAGALEAGLNVALYSNTAVMNIWRFLTSVSDKGQLRDDVDAAVTVVADAAGPVAYYAADQALAGVITAYLEFEPAAPYERGAPLEQQTDEKLMWGALIAARHMDPGNTSGAWDFIWQWLDPVRVDPPAELEEMGMWTRPPEGKPHILWGRNPENNRALYLVVEPSERGRQNMAALRAINPADYAESFFIAGVGAIFGSTAMDTPDAGGAVYAGSGAVPDNAVSAAISLILNPTTVDYAHVTGDAPERRQAAEGYLLAREEPLQ
jgi:hypothetical protein